MKNILFLPFILILAFSSCKKDEEIEAKTIYNNTNFSVNLTHASFNYTLNARQTISIGSNDEPITAATITPITSTNMLFYVTAVNGNYEVGSFNNWVEYRVIGASGKVQVRYNSFTGTLEDTVSLPFTYQSTEKPILGSVLRMEASNLDNTNRESPIRVECYYKDVLIASDDCDGVYCTAQIYVDEY